MKLVKDTNIEKDQKKISDKDACKKTVFPGRFPCLISRKKMLINEFESFL